MAPATIGEIIVGSTIRATKTCRPGMLLEEQLRHQQPEHQLERQCHGGDERRVSQRLPEAHDHGTAGHSCTSP